MGGGSWTTKSFSDYAKTKKRILKIDGETTSQNLFEEKKLHKDLNPFKVIRECCDTQEHPETIPVILALDVTGSMGDACEKTAVALNKIMTELYKNHKDIEFLIMGIGDLVYDRAPLQASQFESDIRIAEAVDKIFMEKGGGGNTYESYSEAWFFGLHNTKLDCWKRGKKGIIITMGDEPLNPYLPKLRLNEVLGCNLQDNVDTNNLYKEAIEKFDIYHIAINDYNNCYHQFAPDISSTWENLLKQNFVVSTIEDLPRAITDCINKSVGNSNDNKVIELTPKENEKEFNEGISLNEGLPEIGW